MLWGSKRHKRLLNGHEAENRRRERRWWKMRPRKRKKQACGVAKRNQRQEKRLLIQWKISVRKGKMMSLL
jgi:hypothetical protein